MSVRPSIGLALALTSALAAGGCSAYSRTEAERDPSMPEREVAVAAKTSFSASVASIAVTALGGPSPWTGSGLIELEEGRFRLEADPDRPHRVRAAFVGDGVTVIGLAGEGFETTVLETVGGPLGRGEGDERCWFNPHAPVGFYADPISVEEAVRVTGSIIESLRAEIATAWALGGDLFEVELERSAEEPRDDFDDNARRVWGDRSLIGDLAGPIEVAVVGGLVERVSYELVHRPDRNWLPGDRSPRRVRVEAALGHTEGRLVIDPPRCQAIE